MLAFARYEADLLMWPQTKTSEVVVVVQQQERGRVVALRYACTIIQDAIRKALIL